MPEPPLTILSSSSSHLSKSIGLDIDGQLSYYLEQLNLLLPQMHLQWLNTKTCFALIDVNPVGGSYQVLAQASTQQQMIENAAVLVRALKRGISYVEAIENKKQYADVMAELTTEEEEEEIQEP